MTGKKDRKKPPDHPHEGGLRRRKGNAHGARKSCTMEAAKKPYTRKADAVSTRKYTIHKTPGYRLTDRERRILAAAWNGYVRRGLRISLRSFARMHGLAAETWRREYRRGAAGATVRIGNRWAYAEYDPGRAADSVREGKSNMGAPMRLTVVSGRGGRGGLLVMIDRCSRRYVAERIGHVSQDCVVRAIGRMRARGALPVVRTVTTDNGCEFPGQRRLDGALGAEVYYTRAYASSETKNRPTTGATRQIMRITASN